MVRATKYAESRKWQPSIRPKRKLRVNESSWSVPLWVRSRGHWVIHGHASLHQLHGAGLVQRPKNWRNNRNNRLYRLFHACFMPLAPVVHPVSVKDSLSACLVPLLPIQPMSLTQTPVQHGLQTEMCSAIHFGTGTSVFMAIHGVCISKYFWTLAWLPTFFSWFDVLKSFLDISLGMALSAASIQPSLADTPSLPSAALGSWKCIQES